MSSEFQLTEVRKEARGLASPSCPLRTALPPAAAQISTPARKFKGRRGLMKWQQGYGKGGYQTKTERRAAPSAPDAATPAQSSCCTQTIVWGDRRLARGDGVGPGGRGQRRGEGRLRAGPDAKAPEPFSLGHLFPEGALIPTSKSATLGIRFPESLFVTGSQRCGGGGGYEAEALPWGCGVETTR